MVELLSDFEMIGCIYLTLQYFPEPGDTRIMDTCCTYFDFDPKYMAYYFEGYVSNEELPAYAKWVYSKMNDSCCCRFMEYLVKRMFAMIEKYKRMGIRKTDTVALMFLSLNKKVDEENMMTTEMAEYKEAMLAEWSRNLCEHYGNKEGPQRLTTLMHTFYESDNLARKLKSYVLMSQVQLNKTREELMCGLSEFMEQLDIDGCE